MAAQRSFWTLFGLLLAGVLVTACAPSPDDPVSDGPGGPVAPGNGIDEPLHLEPTGGLVDPIPTAFQSADVAEDDDRRITLTFMTGVPECYGLDRVDVHETPEEVAITIYVGRNPEAEVCIEIALLATTTVVLDSPLGGRPIIDGSATPP